MIDETEEAEEETTQAATHYARGRVRGQGERVRNAALRQAQALDLRAKGYTLEEVARLVGYSHKSTARKAIVAAMKAIAEDTAEEMRAAFKASYGPVRVALHERARRGDVRAVEALVKLDERECRLFGLDLTPETAALNVQYTKKIVLEEVPAPTSMPGEDAANGNHNDHSAAIWTANGYQATHTTQDD